jgi:hypothetical protein
MTVTGYDILINGVWRSFRDRAAVAFEAARYAKSQYPHDDVQVRKPDGSVVTMRVDGRTDG